MPQYRYRALAQGGEIVVGEVEAPSDDEVLRRIEYLGHLPIDTEVVKPSVLGRSSGIGRRLPRARDVTIFLRQLALLIGAGLPLEAALQTLGPTPARRCRHSRAPFAPRSRQGDSLPRRWSGNRLSSSRSMSPWCVPARPPDGSSRCCARSSRTAPAGTARGPDQFGGALSALSGWHRGRVSPSFSSMWFRSSSRCSRTWAASSTRARRSCWPHLWLRGNLDLVLGRAFSVLGAPMVANKREWRAKVSPRRHRCRNRRNRA